MYKIYEFNREPGDDKTVRLVAEETTTESALYHMLECFTENENADGKYFCFADNAFNADIIRINLWYHNDRHKKEPGYFLYTVYAFNTTSETLEVYPMHVFTYYGNAIQEALDFGSICNDWIFVVATSRNQALKLSAQYSNFHNSAKWERKETETLTIPECSRDIVKTEENCYYSDGILYMKEIREYYDTGDMDEEEEET